MPTKTISFKNVRLVLNNQYELYISCEMWNGALKLGETCVIVNVLGKTKAEITDEAKVMLKEAAATELKKVPVVIDIPSSVPNFNLSVDY